MTASRMTTEVVGEVGGVVASSLTRDESGLGGEGYWMSKSESVKKARSARVVEANSPMRVLILVSSETRDPKLLVVPW